MELALQDAQLEARDVDVVYASANAAPDLDAVEATALGRLFEGGLSSSRRSRGRSARAVRPGALRARWRYCAAAPVRSRRLPGSTLPIPRRHRCALREP